MTTRASLLALTAAATLVFPTAGAGQDAAAGRVEFERTGYRLTSLGARVTVSARVLDARRRAVPNAPIAWRISDPAIAGVSNAGVVQSRRVGRTKVWAVSGTDSASALIMVEQWATTFAFTPLRVQFDAIGVRAPLQVRLRDASGNTIPDQPRRTVQCRSLDERVVTLPASGQLLSKANGVTFIRCTDRGIADSVRVEVRQRPVRALISDKLAIGAKLVGDTFRLRMRALDRQGDSIAGSRPTWASLSPGVVSIDALSGLARSVGQGTAKIVTQIGDVTDTVSVTVNLLPGMVAQLPGADNPGGAGVEAPRAGLSLVQLFPQVGDTVKITMTARDAAGGAIPNPEKDIRILSTDETVARVVDQGTQRVVMLNTGTTWIVAQFTGLGMSIKDSIQISPRLKAGATTASTTTTGTSAVFVRPSFDTAAARRRNDDSLRNVFRTIRQSGIGRVTSGRVLGFDVFVGHAKHSVHLPSAITERRSGVLFGGAGSVAPIRQIVLSGAYRRGNLVADGATGEDLTLIEVAGDMDLWPAPWFALNGGYLFRGEEALTGNTTWSAVKTGATLRFSFVGGAIRTTTSAYFFPLATFKGGSGEEKPDITSLAGETGFELRFSAFSAAFTYYAERFSFPAPSPTQDARVDQFSALRGRIGLKFGR